MWLLVGSRPEPWCLVRRFPSTRCRPAISPSTLAGRAYYRLKQVDLDGSFAYSATRSVYMTSDLLLSWYPSQVEEWLYFEPHTSEVASLTIYAASGQPILARRLLPLDARVAIDLAWLAAGHYWFVWQQGTRRQQGRFAKR